MIHDASAAANQLTAPPKASAEDFRGRFREIVSDPLNLLIRRVPEAGVVRDGLVCLHNGNWVPLEGEGAYFGGFSEILAINRGVHEPLEEYVFQQVVATLPAAPVMMELGSYWAHYSMWLKRVRPGSFPIMVEPLDLHMRAGMANFTRHGFAGEFIQQFVGAGHLEIDAFLASRPGLRLDVLHADIDLHEVDMLQGAGLSLASKKIDRLFVSTHTQALHNEVVEILDRAGYRVEVSSDFDNETTSFDGFVFASNPDIRPLFLSSTGKFECLSRHEIASSDPGKLIASIHRLL
jgi:hypothetical protein